MKKSTLSKLLTLLLATALMFSLAACGSSGSDAPSAPAPAPEAPAPAPDEPAPAPADDGQKPPPPKFEYIYNTSTGHQLIAEALQQMWAEIGIEITLQEQEWSTFLNTRKNGDYEIARNGWLNDYNDPMGMLDLFITGGGNNDGQWSNPEFDALIEAAKKESDPAARMQIMHDAEDILFGEWVVAPVYYYVDLFMISNRVGGFYSSPLGYKYFMYTTTDGAKGGELVVNVGPNPDTIDPALNSAVDGATLCIHAFEGLFTLDQYGTPVPGAAESVDISDDGLVYTFHLRDGLKWSDGSALTAEDFVYSWSRAIDPETAADYGYMFGYIDGVNYDDDYAIIPGSVPNVVAVDDQTLVVTLKYRTPYFLELTAFPTYYPVKQDVVEANGDAWATRPATYISNGAYRMIEWVADSHISYEKNPNYWNYDALGPDVIRFVLMDDANAMLAGFRAGDLLFIDDVPTEEIPALRSDPQFQVEGQLGTYYISFNTQNEDLNPRLREALTLAIDRVYIVEQIGQAGQVPAGAFVSIGIGDATPGVEFRDVGGDYYDPLDYEGNLAKAKAIMAELYDLG